MFKKIYLTINFTNMSRALIMLFLTVIVFAQDFSKEDYIYLKRHEHIKIELSKNKIKIKIKKLLIIWLVMI